jgi:trehalose utilization protein
VENKKLEEKKAKDGKKFQKRKPPDRNFVNWDKQTFERVVAAQPERLTSRFWVSHGMLLNVLSRPGDACKAMRELIGRSHETPWAKSDHRHRTWQLFRALLDAKIIEFIPRTEAGGYLRVNLSWDDFSMARRRPSISSTPSRSSTGRRPTTP